MDGSKESPQSLAMNNQATPKDPERATEQQSTPDGTTTEMPPGGRPRPNMPKREADLSAILTSADKVELTALISWLTDSMLRHFTQLFDPATTVGDTQPSRITFWGKLPYHLKDLSLGSPIDEGQKRGGQKENVNPSRSKKAGRAAEKPNATPNADDAPSQEKDFAPRLQELKKEALQHFKKWHTGVHKRIGEISVKKTEAQNGQLASGPRGRPSSSRRNKLGIQKPPVAVAPAMTLEADPVFAQLYPPRPTTLAFWPAEKRCLLLHALMLLLLSLENYGAYTRVLLLNIASSLRLPLRVLVEDEVRVAGALSHIAREIPPEVLQKKNEEGKPFRRWKAGLASLANVAGPGGGLPQSLVAAGIGSVLGNSGIGSMAAAGLLGTVSENGLTVGSLFGIHGARTNGKMMEHYLKDVCDFAFIPLRGSIGQDSELGKIAPGSRRLRVVLGMNGWLMNKADTTSPWRCLGEQSEVYAVRWELEALSKLGASFEILVKSAAWSMAKKEITARTIFANLVDARWPAGLLKISKIVDNNWNNGMVRADKLGAVLADVLMSKAQGERGVSLIGYSLGARAIYVCLMCLAEKRAFGLVENAIMMGTPAPSDAMAWCAMKSVVTGRLVNVYSENDYILGFLYRTSSIEFGLAGLQRVTGVDGIENLDVTAKISIHTRYQYLVGTILRHIGWADTDEAQIARDEADMSCYEDRNRKHEERRDAIELGKVLVEVKKENEQGVIRTRMRKKGKK